MSDIVFITLVCALVVIVIVVVIMLYHQMLLTNEVNKRLLLLAKDSIDNERSTQEQLNEAVRELEAAANEVPTQEQQETFYPDQEEALKDLD